MKGKMDETGAFVALNRANTVQVFAAAACGHTQIHSLNTVYSMS